MKLFASEGEGGKFATGVNDASGNLPLVSTTPSVNLPAVSMTPVVINKTNISEFSNKFEVVLIE